MVVADGIRYALGFVAGGLLLAYLTNFWLALPLFLFAAFCLYFFRDPEREIPAGPVAVSPADGKVIVVKSDDDAPGSTRISIFMNVFDVHVNRAPISGVVRDYQYKKGEFGVASYDRASEANEQNRVTVEGGGSTVVFKQIAGLIARRIVFYKKRGDTVAVGERVGLIKFGSRVDVFLGEEWRIVVSEGQRVTAGSSVLARRKDD
jgi:phosphatidylserine decarboxylase